MLWIGFGAVVWIVLFIWLGLACLRNGHGWLFFFGIFFPFSGSSERFPRPRRARGNRDRVFDRAGLDCKTCCCGSVSDDGEHAFTPREWL